MVAISESIREVRAGLLRQEGLKWGTKSQVTPSQDFVWGYLVFAQGLRIARREESLSQKELVSRVTPLLPAFKERGQNRLLCSMDVGMFPGLAERRAEG